MSNTAIQPRKDRFAIVSKVAKVVLPLAVSALLVVWLFHKVDIHRVGAIMRSGVDYRYIVAMMLITILSHTIRGIRWGIQLRAVGVPRMSVVAESVSIYSAYALNLVVPYMGEAWRCVYVSRRQHVKLSTVVGTDLGDRISDLVVILSLVVLTLVVANAQITDFLDKYALGRTLHHYATDATLWISVAVALIVAAVALYAFRRSHFVQGMLQSARRIWAGFAVLFHLKDIWLYLLLTIGIWTCYFMETYACFYAFPFTRELVHAPGMAAGFLPGLVVFVFGSCSMAVPSNGGLGPWNVAVMFALSLYGIADADGAAYSIVCWSFQAATYVALGLFSAIYIARTSKKQ